MFGTRPDRYEFDPWSSYGCALVRSPVLRQKASQSIFQYSIVFRMKPSNDEHYLQIKIKSTKSGLQMMIVISLIMWYINVLNEALKPQILLTPYPLIWLINMHIQIYTTLSTSYIAIENIRLTMYNKFMNFNVLDRSGYLSKGETIITIKRWIITSFFTIAYLLHIWFTIFLWWL